MKMSDSLWLDIWSKEKYEPISSNYVSLGFGEDKEPEGSLLMATFANAMGNKFKEKMVLFDYGCGSARFCNFISKRLKDFSYYGVEKPGGERLGEKAIEYARMCFGYDKRISLGLIGDEVEQEAVEKADVALLLSIFTHTTIEEMNTIMDKLLPIISRGGSIVFSAFIRDKYWVGRSGGYGLPDCYSEVHFTKEQFKAMEKRLGIRIVQIDTFITSTRYTHLIFNAHMQNSI